MKKFFADFKAFISKGNIFDMAVGVIIGGAFSPIVSSLVNDIIMPPLGLLFGNEDLSTMKAVLRPEVLDEAGEILTPAVTLNYGAFIAAILNFLIIALVIFTILRAIIKGRERVEKLMSKGKEAAEEAPAEPEEPKETEEDILRDIRDYLKAKNNNE